MRSAEGQRAGAARDGGGRAWSSTPATLTLGSDPAEAAEDLADAGPGRGVLATIADHGQAAGIDAVRVTLADPTGPTASAGLWIINPVGS